MKRLSKVPDLMYKQNNGVIFVVPLPAGQIADLFRKNEKGDIIGWLFSLEEDHPRCGTHEEGNEFLARCENIGLWVDESGKLSVPFSSGPRRRGKFAGYYSPDEYAKVRKDLPSPEQLLELLNA